MIRPDQIPREVCVAVVKAYTDATSVDELIAAALNAWPGGKRATGYCTDNTDYYEPAIALPLPQEKNDDR